MKKPRDVISHRWAFTPYAGASPRGGRREVGFWTWLGTLPQPQASFIGTLTGSFLGLLAILLGALWNAHLNRCRDDRLRANERRSLATALHAELTSIHDALRTQAEDFATKQVSPTEGFTVVDPAHYVRILPGVLDKLGLLDSDTIGKVMIAYGAIDAFCEHMLLAGSRLEGGTPSERRLVFIPADKVKFVAELSEARMQPIAAALAALDAQLPQARRRGLFSIAGCLAF
jgi:hypothetical protein